MSADLIPLSDLAARINAAHNQAEQHARSAVEHALRCGELLIEAKAKVDHGQWLPWLKANCAVSERMVRAYMQLGRALPAAEDRQRVAVLPLREALKALSAPDGDKAPESPMEAADPEDAERREYGGFTLHPACRIWPRITGKDWADFVISIKTHGLIVPITLYEGQILDGKERMRACLEARVSPWFREYAGNDPLGYTVSTNWHRDNRGGQRGARILEKLAAREAKGAGHA